MEELKSIKKILTNSVMEQLSKMDNVDTKELGEVIDMIKDLEKTIYYCAVVKAMEEDTEYAHEVVKEKMNVDTYIHKIKDMVMDFSPEEKSKTISKLINAAESMH